MWLLIALLGYFLLSIVLLLDKFILTKAIDKPSVYAFWSTIFVFPLLFVAPFVGAPVSASGMLISACAGLSFGMALFALYTGVQRGEATHLYPFNGSALIVGTYVISRAVLAETLSNSQVFGVLALCAASLLLTIQKKHAKFYWNDFLWVGASGFLFALSLTLAKFLYQTYPFFTALLWVQGMACLTAVVLFFASPAVRQSVFGRGLANKKKTKGGVWIVIANKALSVSANLLIQLAIALGSVTIVNALSGLQYVLVFVFMLVLTRFFPRALKEKFTRREIAVQTIAICLVVFGAALVAL